MSKVRIAIWYLNLKFNMLSITGYLVRLSFGMAILMMSGATSMSRRQPYGKGWLDGECFLVKDWVYVVSGGLILVTTVFTIGSAILMLQTTPNQQTTHNQRQTQLQQQSLD